MGPTTLFTHLKIILLQYFQFQQQKVQSKRTLCLAKTFPHLSTNHPINLISIAFCLFGDLLVPPRFACNLT